MKLPKDLPTGPSVPTAQRPSGLVVADGGRVLDVPMKRLDGQPLLLIEFESVAAALIDYFQHPDFPNAPIATNRLHVEGVDAQGFAASEAWVRVTCDCERHYDWYTKWGMVAKIISENKLGRETGGFPRKVNLIVAYNEKDPARKCVSVLIEVGAMEVRMKRQGSEEIVKLK